MVPFARLDWSGCRRKMESDPDFAARNVILAHGTQAPRERAARLLQNIAVFQALAPRALFLQEAQA
jgi:hypothetical protein